MSIQTLFISFSLPLGAGILELLLMRRSLWLKNLILLLGTALNLWVAWELFGKEASYITSWGAFNFQFALRLYNFSAFILLGISVFGFLIALFSSVFMRNHKESGQFFGYFLLTIGMANGATLANDLIVLLFFWEGLLLTLFGMIAVGHRDAYKTAIKAFVICGITDLCMLVGIGLTAHLAKTTIISSIHLQTGGLASLAFILLAIGAVSKAGSMPFHSWIPDAAKDAPLPFMALLPGTLEKLVGIYFLSRITLDMFALNPESRLSLALMILGAMTIFLAVLMALIQKDFKRLLSFHAISQVGYMILGIGTAIPVGIVGGLFHMINHAVYKSCLFLTGGAVEIQTGTSNLKALGGLYKKMPVTFFAFLIAALSISGVPPFNGFFSKELVYDGALQRGMAFYVIALAGSFLTAASFLKLGHAAFFGAEQDNSKNAKEAPALILIPLVVLAGICILFGLWNSIPLHHLIQPILGERLEGHDFAGPPHSLVLVAISCGVFLLAIANHWVGVKRSGSGLGAVDHIHYAPVLHSIYNRAEKRHFDPYELSLKVINIFASVAFTLDRLIDWLYNKLVPFVAFLFARMLKQAHNGSHITYVAWSLLGFLFILFTFIYT
ncbi:MAG: NADH-quinone oxidoreductase subunit L [SAR324 cluster bacterium]|uniref:NADH-quinone oxidoreductase subunit L n=1 Tax=SAR324 cluster bacterium TaxID=2024889 RepID=A0A7X9FUS7_9DELT|nr:NADH-quinone oxidoreductase subunit L [SAR324 cluster bacterium]